MNKIKILVSSLFLLVVFSFLISSDTILATVGGPTYISAIASDAAGTPVFYTVNDNGGRGCPPIVHKIDLVTSQDTPVKSCDDFENEFTYSTAGLQKYNQFISDVYQNLGYLGSVSLEKNNIDIRVEFVSEEIQADYSSEPVWTNFRAHISQDGKELGTIDFRGCSVDQPHVFEGYMIPNSDKMVILISNKGDCFEGGYVKESLHMIGGVNYHDTNAVRGFKTASATEPNSGNVVVYAFTQPVSTGNDDTKSSEGKYFGILLLGLIALVVGLVAGYFVGKKSGNIPPVPPTSNTN